jgi:hypothetical protein
MAKRKPKPSAPSKFDALRKAKKPKKREPLWTLEKGLTYSSLSLFEECPEQFALAYVDGWSSKRISIPLEFGSVMHSCLEHQYCGKSPQEIAFTVTEEYRKRRTPTLINSSENDVLNFICELAKITFPHYCDYWGKDDQQLTWIVREGQFAVHYPLAMEDGKVNKILLRGMRDGIYKTPRGGITGIFETKNKSRISEQELRDGLRADMQTLFYALTTWIETGIQPKQVLYNIIRRSDMYRRKGEPLPSLIKRVKEDMEKRPDFYFVRFTVDLLPSDITIFQEKTLNPLLRRFIHWWDSVKKNPSPNGRWKSPYHFRSLSHLIGKYGKVNLWELAVNGNAKSYFRRSAVFPELEELAESSLVS